MHKNCTFSGLSAFVYVQITLPFHKQNCTKYLLYVGIVLMAEKEAQKCDLQLRVPYICGSGDSLYNTYYPSKVFYSTVHSIISEEF